MRSWSPAAAVALAFAVGPSTAHAASVNVARGTFTFEAVAGEANRLAVTSAPGVFRIVDSGAPLTLGVGCRPRGPHAAECDRAGVERLLVRLGDGDDTVTMSVSVGATLAGGDGDDLLEGGETDDILRGGAGVDTLLGGDGFDMLGGGPGPDVLSGGTDASSRDVPLELDLVSYTGTTSGVRVTPDGVPDDGEAGEGDNVLPDVEIVVGGRGNDTLIGNDEFLNALAGGGGDDTLRGGGGEIDVLFGELGNDDLFGEAGEDILAGARGDDRLRGGAGSDELNGGAGRDVLLGDAGADDLEARDGERDAVSGGDGRDRASLDRLDVVLGVELVRRPRRAGVPVAGRADRAAVRRALSRARA